MIASVKSQGHQPWVATSTPTSRCWVRPHHEAAMSSSIYPRRRRRKLGVSDGSASPRGIFRLTLYPSVELRDGSTCERVQGSKAALSPCYTHTRARSDVLLTGDALALMLPGVCVLGPSVFACCVDFELHVTLRESLSVVRAVARCAWGLRVAVALVRHFFPLLFSSAISQACWLIGSGGSAGGLFLYSGKRMLSSSSELRFGMSFFAISLLRFRPGYADAEDVDEDEDDDEDNGKPTPEENRMRRYDEIERKAWPRSSAKRADESEDERNKGSKDKRG
jgi:hypothetical protein